MSRRTLARHRLLGHARFARTSAEGGGGGGTGGGGTGQSDSGQGGSGQSGGGEGGQSAEGGASGGQSSSAGGTDAKFTQADLDRILGERLAAEKAKHDQALKDAQALAGKNETEKLTIERDQALAKANETAQKSAERVARTEAKVAALAAGANPQRVDAIIRTADLAAAVKDGDVDEAAVKSAVEKVLADFPEWKATTTSSASGGEMNGGGNGKPTFTRKQIEDMSDAERVRRIDEINEAIADGRVTG